MAVRSSGQLGLRSDIQAEFGGPTTNIPISRYWRGGSYVLDIPANAAVPTGGESKWSNWYSSTAAFYYNYTLAAGNYATNLNILNACLAAGYENNGSRPAIVNITIAGILGSVNWTYALDTGIGWSTDVFITIGISSGGYITGAGAANGNPSDGWGGNALLLQVPATVINNGIIQAGGGRGSQGEAGCYGGGCGYIGGPGIRGPGGGFGFPEYGTLEIGGANQDGGGKKAPEGGPGGGWVADGSNYGGSQSTDGYGRTPGGGSIVTPPGIAIMNWGSNAIIPGSVYGVVRGFVDTNPSLPPPPPAPPPGPPPSGPGCLGPSTQVLTPQGWYMIEELTEGTQVMDHNGALTTVLAVKQRQVDQTPVYNVNGVDTTADHLFLTDRGWACVDPLFYNQIRSRHRHMVMSNGLVVDQLGLARPDQVHKLELGDILITSTGPIKLERLEHSNFMPSDYLYGVCTEAGTMVVSHGIIAEAYPRAKN